MAKKKSEIQELMEFIRDKVAAKADLKDLASKEDLKAALAPIQATLDEHTDILNDHTRQLNIVRKDAETNLDKRLQLDVRVDRLEKARR